MASATKPPGTFQIYKKAFDLSKKNLKLILLVFLIYLITSIILSAITKSSTNLTLEDFAKKTDEIINANHENSTIYYKIIYQAIMKDFIKDFSAISVLRFVVTFVINSLRKIMVLYAFATTYCHNYITLKELLLGMVMGNLKGPIINQILVTVLKYGCATLFMVFTSLFVFLGNSSELIMNLVFVFIPLITVLAFMWWILYLETWWLLSTIVSVTEEGCYGLSAVKKALHFIKGSKWKVVSITLLDVLGSTVFSAVYGFILGSFGKGELWSKLLLEWIGLAGEEVFAFLFYAAMTVYYNSSMNEKSA